MTPLPPQQVAYVAHNHPPALRRIEILQNSHIASEAMRYAVCVLRSLLISIVLTACMVGHQPSPDEMQALDHPPPQITAKIDYYYPRALAWYEDTEAKLLPQGRQLSLDEEAMARALGVTEPGRVRVVTLTQFPMPDDPGLRREAEQYGMGSVFEGGRTIGYVIMLKPRYANDRIVLRHELVHVAQHDRLGRSNFIKRYFTELEIVGYANAPLELEAYEKQEDPK